jgi:CheY-like chemotaxis protein
MSITEKIAVAATPAGTILVVDDNELNRDLLSRRLRRDGHTVIVAEHGVPRSTDWRSSRSISSC